MKRLRSIQIRPESQELPYSAFQQINGEHPYKKAVPSGFVEYQVRTRPGGKVMYFNFALAKEMGLLPENHVHQLNDKLTRMILDTFAIVIINEYDILTQRKFQKSKIKPHKYMATRYLQLQHPSKNGMTSGDGRSIWNGTVTHKGTRWDVSSCGTGATCLSPASAIENKYFKTGDKDVSYGCGYADVTEGLSAALMSEIFHKNGVPTERTLAVIEFPGGFSVNVRVSKNLIRPSHFFTFLKQSDYEGLASVVNYYIDRQVQNGAFPPVRDINARYRHFAESFSKTFARMAARFESDYIFCWLDWDGDNILTEGGIIDYGSVRQFGLYHHEYRYDDVQRWSTSIPEQKTKARYLVQTIAQMTDYLITGKKKSIKTFANDPTLKLFDTQFKYWINHNLLHRIGFNATQCETLLKKHEREVGIFRAIHSHFEKTVSKRGIYTVADGITSDAVFCMRDILRELPAHFSQGISLMDSKTFIEIAGSDYAKKRDLELNAYRIQKIQSYQKAYLHLVELASQISGVTPERAFREIRMRSSVLNPYDRVTGDGIIHITDELIRKRKRMPFTQFIRTIEKFIEYQRMDPASGKKTVRKDTSLLRKMISVVQDMRESL